MAQISQMKFLNGLIFLFESLNREYRLALLLVLFCGWNTIQDGQECPSYRAVKPEVLVMTKHGAIGINVAGWNRIDRPIEFAWHSS